VQQVCIFTYACLEYVTQLCLNFPHEPAGEDYVATVTTVIFDPGERMKEVGVTLLDDVVLEGTESFRVTLSTEEVDIVLTPGTAIVNIVEDDRE